MGMRGRDSTAQNRREPGADSDVPLDSDLSAGVVVGPGDAVPDLVGRAKTGIDRTDHCLRPATYRRAELPALPPSYWPYRGHRCLLLPSEGPAIIVPVTKALSLSILHNHLKVQKLCYQEVCFVVFGH